MQFRIFSVPRPQIRVHLSPRNHTRARPHSFQPAVHVRLVIERLLLTLPKRGPAKDREISDGDEITRDKRVLGQSAVEYTVEPPGL